MTPPGAARPPSLLEFLSVIARIGLTSFGGGISGWLLRIVVQERRWVSEAEFLSGLGVCQVFPGVNVVNISIWLGYRLHGNWGAVLGPCAIVVPPALVIVGIAELFLGVSQRPVVHTGLAGVAAAAIGLGAVMGLRAARRCLHVVPGAILVATFVCVGLLHLPLLWVLLVLAPVSVAYAWRRA